MCQGVSAFSAAQDQLHCVEQGPVLHHLGGILKRLCYEFMPGTPQQNLDSIWEAINVIYRKLGTPTRCSNLRLSMFLDASKPHAKPAVLKVKAAEARHLVPVFAILLEALAAQSEACSHMQAACSCLERFYKVCENAGYVLNDGESDEALEQMTGFLVHYQWLNCQAVQANSLDFHFVPKHHYCKHLAEEAKYLNPRLSWTYRAEDFIGKMSDMAYSCIKGTRSCKIAAKCLVKYRHLLHLALKHRLHDI